MRQQVEFACAQHPSRHNCPDALVGYVAKFDEYGILVHDGGTAMHAITFCPWCGTRLPASRRDRWFAELDALGIDPWAGDIPIRYRSDAWYRDGDATLAAPTP